jgi:hypothetical protein
MAGVTERIDSFDEDLFSEVEAQLAPEDRRVLLGLQAAVAAKRTPFAYLEIGSYRGGSLQVLIRDPRCDCIMSIDPRTRQTPDSARGAYTYEDNTTERMLALLAHVPDADMAKLSTFEASVEDLHVTELPRRPDYCFVDGEHTDEAVLRDGRFCAKAVDGEGIVAFHDAQLVKPGIRAFLDEAWPDISHAIAFPGQVFAVELGGRGVLADPIVERTIDSKWHSTVWRIASRPSRTTAPLLATWSAVERIDDVTIAPRGGCGPCGPAGRRQFAARTAGLQT